MAKYLRMYDTLPLAVKPFFTEEEFVADISKIWGLQKVYEVTKWPPGWPFGSTGDVPGLAEHIGWAKSQGATDKDIAWWWNLSPVDRVLIRTTDQAFWRMVMAKFINDGFSPEEMMEKMVHAFPIYIENSPTLLSMIQSGNEDLLGEDGMLPIELHDRVDLYFKNQPDEDSLGMVKQEKDSFSSVNAWIRHLIRIGKI